MADYKQIIDLYSELADRPDRDFGWAKGIENARSHKYKREWFETLPLEIWDYCAAVGNPFSLGDIPKGSTVVDLGCGAGVDLLISALLAGEEGKAIGIDITPKMVSLAKKHAQLAGFKNVEVLENSFEKIELEDESVDVVISNGAINLTSCKESVFSEINRILKPNGKLYFADMIDTSIDEGSCCSVESSSSCDSNEEDWANCVAGTLKEERLIEIIKNAGFDEVERDSLTHYTTSQTTRGATFKAKKIPSEKARQVHWDTVFQKADYKQVLWHQELPTHSLELIKAYTQKHDAVIDVGCGASVLVDNLLDQGYKNISLLDTSMLSLEIVRQRLKDQPEGVRYECCDILNFSSEEKFKLWHDRAVFHFLLLKKEREKYFEILQESLVSKGIAIINTFAVGGEIQCAGLDILQYNAEKMTEELPSGLKLLNVKEYNHITPKKSEQKYISFVIEKSST